MARYYTACETDYWYHGASYALWWRGPKDLRRCTAPGTARGVGGTPTDLSNSSGAEIHPAAKSLNGSYNTGLLAEEAARLVRAHPAAEPFYMYLAFMAVHDACTDASSVLRNGTKQAPLATVNLYNRTVLDTYKVAGAMYTELDRGIGTVIGALREQGMWEAGSNR